MNMYVDETFLASDHWAGKEKNKLAQGTKRAWPTRARPIRAKGGPVRAWPIRAQPTRAQPISAQGGP